MCALKDFLWQWTRDDAGLRAPRGDVGRVVGKGFEGGERERERPDGDGGGLSSGCRFDREEEREWE